MRHETAGEEPAKPLKNSSRTARQPFETGGTSRPRPKSPTVDPSSRRPRNFRTITLNEYSERLLWQSSLHAIQSRVRSTFMPAMSRCLRYRGIPRHHPLRRHSVKRVEDVKDDASRTKCARTRGRIRSEKNGGFFQNIFCQRCKHCRKRFEMVCWLSWSAEAVI